MNLPAAPDVPPAGGRTVVAVTTPPYETLRSLRCLADVPDDGVAWLASVVEERRYGVGDVLITEGATDRDCWFLVEGETSVTAGGAVLGVSGVGEPEGEMALLFRRPRGATTTVTSPVLALVLRAADWDRLEAEQPERADGIRGGLLQHLGRRFGRPPSG